ncbi:MAG: hypothetical protein HY360_05605 [Verrucomicrobia bacterium]|nr:hypothetical protein [Verrucomicrobiota bacterium]
MKTTTALMLMFAACCASLADQPAEKTDAAAPPKTRMVRHSDNEAAYAPDDAILERLRLIERTYLDALKPAVEDGVADDPYSRGWPEIFGAEAKRFQRLEKARKLADKLREEVARDLEAARASKRTQRLEDLEFEKLKTEMQLDTERARARLEKEMLTERAKVVSQIVETLKKDPDAEINLAPDGTITIRKGKQPQPQPPVLIR